MKRLFKRNSFKVLKWSFLSGIISWAIYELSCVIGVGNGCIIGWTFPLILTFLAITVLFVSLFAVVADVLLIWLEKPSNTEY